MANTDKVLNNIVEAGMRHSMWPKGARAGETQNEYSVAWVEFIEEVRRILLKGR